LVLVLIDALLTVLATQKRRQSTPVELLKILPVPNVVLVVKLWKTVSRDLIKLILAASNNIDCFIVRISNIYVISL